jgi:AcrR family transcriptional regulator/DNA-binding MarR family transcriptional regulator
MPARHGSGPRMVTRVDAPLGSRGIERVSSVGVAGVQRARLLAAAVEIAGELGYGAMSTARVSARAGVSRKTFYELFADREDCFLAVFEDAVARATVVAQDAAFGREGWREQVRAGLGALLGFLEGEPGLGSLLVVGVLGAGPRVLERRARVLDVLAGVIDAGRSEATDAVGPPPLTAEGVVGAVLSVIHGRISSSGWGGASRSRTHRATCALHTSEGGRRDAPPIAALMDLLNPLMAMIVLPYLGRAASATELERRAPTALGKRRGRASRGFVAHPLKGLEMRLTSRTLLVVFAISELGGRGSHPSNREVAEHAGITDPGQISKLLARLERVGLAQNTGDGQAKGEANAWRLTAKGRQLAQGIATDTRTHAHRRAA